MALHVRRGDKLQFEAKKVEVRVRKEYFQAWRDRCVSNRSGKGCDTDLSVRMNCDYSDLLPVALRWKSLRAGLVAGLFMCAVFGERIGHLLNVLRSTATRLHRVLPSVRWGFPPPPKHFVFKFGSCM